MEASGFDDYDSDEADVENSNSELSEHMNNPDRLEAYCVKLETKGCNLCDLGGGTVVVSRGYVDSELMIIGQNPGATEIKLQSPFVGPAGKYLNSMLARTGLASKNPYITNVGLCGTPENRPLDKAELAACRVHLDKQIELLDPLMMIIIGKPAAVAFFPHLNKSPMMDIVELNYRYHFPLDLFSGEARHTIPCVVIYHPSYLLRLKGSDKFQDIEDTNIRILNSVYQKMEDERERRKGVLPIDTKTKSED